MTAALTLTGLVGRHGQLQAVKGLSLTVAEHEVLAVIAGRPNVCKQLHMPAQSGASGVLERMRRGYTREAYDELVAHVRSVIPEVALR